MLAYCFETEMKPQLSIDSLETIDAVNRSAEENADSILAYLIEQGFILQDFHRQDTEEPLNQLPVRS